MGAAREAKGHVAGRVRVWRVRVCAWRAHFLTPKPLTRSKMSSGQLKGCCCTIWRAMEHDSHLSRVCRPSNRRGCNKSTAVLD